MKKGFIIANQHEEFVASFDIQETHTALVWSVLPGYAHVFKSRGQCRKVMKALADPKYSLWEMTLLETKSKYIVACSTSVVPPWFQQTR